MTLMTAPSPLFPLVFNAALGWWWADSVAALVRIYYGIRESVGALGGCGTERASRSRSAG